MTESNANDRAAKLIQKVFNLLTIIDKNENGTETRRPGSEQELIASRKILKQISELNVTDEELLKLRNEYVDLLDEYEEKLMYIKSPNGLAESLLQEIFMLWSNVSTEDDNEHHAPSNDDEVKRSWALIQKVEEIDFDEDTIKGRLKTYRKLLETYTENKGVPAGEYHGKYEQAWKKLGEIFSLWGDINTQNGNEFRSPANKKEIKKSRVLMSEVKSLGCSEQDVLERIEELEGVINSTADVFPKYKGKIIRAIIFSLVFMIGLYFFLTKDTYETPEINYEEEWFVTKKGGYLLWDAFISEKELPKVKQKLYLKKGTQLSPIAQIGNWVQVETEDGQKGLVDPLILNGSKYVVSNPKATIFREMGSGKIDTIAAGIPGIIIDRYTNEDQAFWDTFLKIKFEDGKIRWAHDYDFKQLMMKTLPEIDQLYYHTTNVGMLQKLTIGKQLPEFEKHYGPATSVLKINGNYQAFFKHIFVMDEGELYEGVLVNLDDDYVAITIEYITKGRERTYEIFPLVNVLRDAEIQKGGRHSLYRNEAFKLQWWEDFKDMNWFTIIIGWIVWFILLVSAVFLSFSIPKIIISPIMQIFTYNKIFTNGKVMLINALVLFIVYYLFFVLSILMMDQWLIPAIGSVALYFFWLLRLSKNILYNRCALCNVMYSALDKGSTFTGRKTNVTWGTWEKDKGTSSYVSGNTKQITHHSEIRDTKTTEHVDSYLDHLICALCGYDWDVDRTETKEHKVHY